MLFIETQIVSYHIFLNFAKKLNYILTLYILDNFTDRNASRADLSMLIFYDMIIMIFLYPIPA